MPQMFLMQTWHSLLLRSVECHCFKIIVLTSLQVAKTSLIAEILSDIKFLTFGVSFIYGIINHIDKFRKKTFLASSQFALLYFRVVVVFTGTRSTINLNITSTHMSQVDWQIKLLGI